MSDGKTIVVSDIHMGSQASYSWFRDAYPTQLAALFNQIANDATVEQLVLLGDVFDTWLYPINVVPFTFDQIIATWDTPVIAALKNCVAKVPVVYYLNGNHDMDVTQANLNALSSGGKNIQWITYDDYNALYKGVRHFEHGNAVDMFNAPDTSGDTIGTFPLGYFITRLACMTGNATTAKAQLADLVTAHHAKLQETPESNDGTMGNILVEVIIDALCLKAGVKDSDPIRFADPDLDKQGITVATIKQHYRTLLLRWLLKYPLNLLDSMLTGLLPGGLDWYAKKLAEDKTAPLIVLGHTHHGEAESYGYDNTGCWCDTAQEASGQGPVPTYVEIINNKATLRQWS